MSNLLWLTQKFNPNFLLGEAFIDAKRQNHDQQDYEYHRKNDEYLPLREFSVIEAVVDLIIICFDAYKKIIDCI